MLKATHPFRSRLYALDLRFIPELEARYAAHGETARLAHLRLTIIIGVIAYDFCGLLDHVILPDLAYAPAAIRLFVATPLALALFKALPRMSSACREISAAALAMLASLFQISFFAASDTDLVPYALMPVLVLSMYANVIMQLRGLLALVTSAIVLSAVWISVHLRPDVPAELQDALCLAITLCTLLGLVSNHQLERAQRQAFLHIFDETLTSEKLRLEKAMLSKLSMIDALTGLANRRAFDHRIAELWHVGKLTGNPFSLLLVDVDFFKGYNDHYGHLAGDACLSHLARSIEDVVIRKQDLTARYGGEEFAILLADCSADDATKVAELLRRKVAQAAIPHQGRCDGLGFVSVSIGVADYDPASPETIEAIIALADRRLYAAKREGRNRVIACVHDVEAPSAAA